MANQTYLDYQNEYGVKLPDIDKINIVDKSGSWVSFCADDLYNKKYIMYVNSKLFNLTDEFIEQIYYHEFTHIIDSLRFLNYNINDFKIIMAYYSEFHAAKIEMEKRINQANQNKISLDTEIIHGDGILTIGSFINQAYIKMIKNINLMKCRHDFSIKSIFYFIGYKEALQTFGLNYQEDDSLISKDIISVYYKLVDDLTKDNLNYDDLLLSLKQFEDSIKNICLISI